MRYQSLSEHFLGNFARFGGRFDDVDAAFESVFECPLPSPAGVDLRFYDDADRPSGTGTN